MRLDVSHRLVCVRLGEGVKLAGSCGEVRRVGRRVRVREAARSRLASARSRAGSRLYLGHISARSRPDLAPRWCAHDSKNWMV